MLSATFLASALFVIIGEIGIWMTLSAFPSVLLSTSSILSALLNTDVSNILNLIISAEPELETKLGFSNINPSSIC